MTKDNIIRSFHSCHFYYEASRMIYAFDNYIICHAASRQDIKWKSVAITLGQTKNHVGKWYFVAMSEEAFVDRCNQFLEDPILITDLEKDLLKIEGVFNREVEQLEFSSLSNADLGKLYILYLDQREKLSMIATTLRYIDRASVLNFKKIFGKQNVNKALQESIVSERLTMTQEEERDVLQSAVKIDRSSFSLDSDDGQHIVDQLTKKYTWITYGYYNETEKTKQDYTESLQTLLENNPKRKLREFDDRIAHALHIQKKILDQLSKKDQDVVKLASEATFLKDFYKMTLNRMIHKMQLFWVILAERVNLTVSETKDLLPAEIEKLLDGGKIDQQIIQVRSHNTIFIGDQKEFCTLTGADANTFQEKYLKALKYNKTTKLIGRNACPGVYEGSVRVIRSSDEFHKMQDGDVIVALNTTPDYVPIMKRAGAVVTEEGGITSHASVVSRELGVPCIVGVEHVTEKLCDSDIIKVDANNGSIVLIHH